MQAVQDAASLMTDPAGESVEELLRRQNALRFVATFARRFFLFIFIALESNVYDGREFIASIAGNGNVQAHLRESVYLTREKSAYAIVSQA